MNDLPVGRLTNDQSPQIVQQHDESRIWSAPLSQGEDVNASFAAGEGRR